MSDIAAFIRARLDEDEAHACKDLWALDRATPGIWRASYGTNLPYSLMLVDGAKIARFVSSAGPLADGAEDLHAADAMLVGRLVRSVRARAERVLREVAAKRMVVDRYEAMQAGVEAAEGTLLAGASRVRLGAYLNVLHDLAAIWVDHPDFDPNWRTDG